MPAPTVVASARRRACLVSHRLGGFDGVSVEAAKWQRALDQLGWSVTRAAGFFADEQAATDVPVPGLWATTPGGRPPVPDTARIADLCRIHDLLILDNAGTLPTATDAAIAFEEEALRHRTPTIVRHHDPPWQVGTVQAPTNRRLPLNDPRMLHVTINRLTEVQFRRRFPRLAATEAITTIHNTVDTAALGHGRRWATRHAMGIDDRDVLLVHPARNIGRKNVPAALGVAAALARRSRRRVHYWLTDPDGEVEPSPAHITVHRGHAVEAADLYAAADLVLLPSRWEGWGLPVLEAAAAQRPAVTYPYPVLSEIHRLGIRTVDHADSAAITRLVSDPSAHGALTAANLRRAAALDVRRLPRLLEDAAHRASELMSRAGTTTAPASRQRAVR